MRFWNYICELFLVGCSLNKQVQNYVNKSKNICLDDSVVIHKKRFRFLINRKIHIVLV